MDAKKIILVGLSLFVFGVLLLIDVRGQKPESQSAYECEGDACEQVTLTWENDRQQFRVQNNSDRPAKVEVTTYEGESSVRVPPKRASYLEVKTFNGPYRANYQDR